MKRTDKFYFFLKLWFIVLIFLLILQYIFGNNKRENLTYADIEKSFSICRTLTNNSNVPEGKENCPKNGIVTAIQGGRLGNQIWQYISIWLVAKETGLTPYVPKCIKSRLQSLFDNLSIPDLDEISNCPIEKPIFPTRDYKDPDAINKSILLKIWITESDLLIKNYKEIKKLFTIRKNLLDTSQKLLQLTVINSKNKHTFVGVHVRRKEYLNFVKIKFKLNPDMGKYFHDAMSFFEKKYPDCVFVVVSDDPEWCVRVFMDKSNVYVTGVAKRNSPELDIAIMASCNHSIIDYGTFGQWGALLAGGDTIYYPIIGEEYSTTLGNGLSNWYTLDEVV